jgi:hypothetical protein
MAGALISQAFCIFIQKYAKNKEFLYKNTENA